MAKEQAVGVREQSDPSAAATPEAEAQTDALAAPTQPVADEDVAADEESAGELEELLAKAAERDEYLALAQRTQADFENYRKRVARDSATAESRGLARLARELLPALDSLDRALAAAADADEVLIEGLRLVQRELLGALERVGVEPYGAAGEQFDPELHEAVAQQPFDGCAPGEIVEVYQSGYRLAGGVIRPARVLVAG
jgi:molecular chaperone GrpE